MSSMMRSAILIGCNDATDDPLRGAGHAGPEEAGVPLHLIGPRGPLGLRQRAEQGPGDGDSASLDLPAPAADEPAVDHVQGPSGAFGPVARVAWVSGDDRLRQ